MSNISDFYDKESSLYSNKRYFGIADTYVKYFFQKRLSILLDYFEKYLCLGDKKIKLLEIGCADGVLINNLKKKFPNSFEYMIGVDIAPEMIRVATDKNGDKKTLFYVRGKEPDDRYDVVMAIGFMTVGLFKKDISYFKRIIKKDGYLIWSVASVGSLANKLSRIKRDLSEYKTFKEGEDFARENFEIVAERPYGFFIPKLWAFPSFARFLQPIIDRIFESIFPELFHEKIYLLKLK